MPFDYTTEADEAAELVLENGTTATFLKYKSAADDGAKPWRGNTGIPPDVTLNNVAIVRVSPNEPHLGISRLREKDNCKDMEQVLIVAPGSAVTDDLLGFDAVVDGSTTWIILDGEKLQPGDGPAILYYIAVKR